jgi:hypothetical protein
VKIRGVRIEPGEVVSAARRHPSVHDAVVICRDQTLLCYVTPKAGAPDPASAARIRQYLGEQLPAPMVPTHVVFVEAFPLTENGKLDIERLPSTDGSRPALDVSYLEPTTQLERTLAHIWRELLGLDVVGVLDNFFDLGGHSLLLPQLQVEIEKRMGFHVRLPQLLEFPTVQLLARHLQAGAAEITDAPEAGADADRGERQRESRLRLAQRQKATGGDLA